MAPHADEDTSRPRVLVADDEPHIRRVLLTMLDASGYRVDEVEDGVQALERLRDETVRYDLVLLDLMMPGHTGLDLLEALSSMPARAGVPVVVLTAKGQDTDRQEAMALGAAAFVTKPFSPKKLLARLDALLAR